MALRAHMGTPAHLFKLQCTRLFLHSPSCILMVVPIFFYLFLRLKIQVNQLNMAKKFGINIFDYEGHYP